MVLQSNSLYLLNNQNKFQQEQQCVQFDGGGGGRGGGNGEGRGGGSDGGAIDDGASGYVI